MVGCDKGGRNCFLHIGESAFLVRQAVQQSLIVDPDTEEASGRWTLVLRAAAACTKLESFVLYIYSESKGNRDIDIHVWDEELVSKAVDESEERRR